MPFGNNLFEVHPLHIHMHIIILHTSFFLKKKNVREKIKFKSEGRLFFFIKRMDQRDTHTYQAYQDKIYKTSKVYEVSEPNNITARITLKNATCVVS